jgi:hypothetical protein
MVAEAVGLGKRAVQPWGNGCFGTSHLPIAIPALGRASTLDFNPPADGRF